MALGAGSSQAQHSEAQFPGQTHQDQVDEELIHMILDPFICGHLFEPGRGRHILGGQQLELVDVRSDWGGKTLAEGGECIVEPDRRFKQLGLDTRGQIPGNPQPFGNHGVGGVRGVVKQEDTLEVRKLLEGGGPQCGADYLRLLGV